MGAAAPWNRWSAARIKRFCADWDDGLEASFLTEKYGARAPYKIARQLRAAGYTLKPRLRSPRTPRTSRPLTEHEHATLTAILRLLLRAHETALRRR